VPKVQPGRRPISRLPLGLLALLLSLSALACDSSEASSTSSTGAPPSEPNTSNAPETSSTSPVDVPTTTTPASAPSGPPGPADFSHPAGFKFSYPEGWVLAGQLISTEFATQDDCVSVVAADEDLPPDSGQAGFRFQSVVQFCIKDASAQSLEQHLESTYGAGIPGFQITEVGGRVAYRSDDGNEILIFTEVDNSWLQIAASIAAEPGLETQRVEEVNEILESVTLG
jgi:hypothetical protein